MKVYVALPKQFRDVLFTDEDWARLEAVGDVEVMPDDATSLPERVCDEYDLLVTGWGTPKLERVDGSRLQCIVHTSGSWRGAMGPEVFESDVAITQAGSDPMARAVAEFALTMELSMLRALITYDRGMQTTRDYRGSRHPEFTTAVHTVRHGLVGLSRVGVWHARMLRGLGVTDIVAYDPYFPAERAEELGVTLTTLDEVMASPLVAAHAPVTDETRKMLGAEQFALMPDDGLFLNTARAAIIDGPALEAELVSGRIRAALDVFDEEPLPADSPLYGLPNVLLTPHVAGATVSARWEQGSVAIDEIERFAKGEELQQRVAPGTAVHLS